MPSDITCSPGVRGCAVSMADRQATYLWALVVDGDLVVRVGVLSGEECLQRRPDLDKEAARLCGDLVCEALGRLSVRVGREDRTVTDASCLGEALGNRGISARMVKALRLCQEGGRCLRTSNWQVRSIPPSRFSPGCVCASGSLRSRRGGQRRDRVQSSFGGASSIASSCYGQRQAARCGLGVSCGDVATARLSKRPSGVTAVGVGGVAHLDDWGGEVVEWQAMEWRGKRL